MEFLILRRSLPLTKEELRQRNKVHLKQLQNKTTEYARKTRRSVDLKLSKSIVDIQEDDIPNWMKT